MVKELWNEEKIRLVGVSIGKFTNNLSHQLSLFEDSNSIKEDNELDKTLDRLKIIYGNNIIDKAIKFKK